MSTNIKQVNIFKKPQDQYKANVSPVKHYIEQMAIYITKFSKLDYNTAVKKIVEVIKKNPKGTIKNPIVKYYQRQENGDRVIEEDKLTNYIKFVYNENKIMVPSFTVYTNHEEKLSIHAKYLDYNVKGRSKAKKLAFKYKMEGDIEKYNFYNTLQKTKKIKNNSLSGAYASKSTILYNPSAHYTLTSITRTVASIGNALAESVVAGNRLYQDPETVINHILSLIYITDKKAIIKAMNRFKIKVPTTDEIMDMILYSSRLYWKDENKEQEIRELVDRLNTVEKAIVMYVNDFYHLRKLNEKLVKSFLTKMSDVHYKEYDNPLDLVYQFPEYILNLVAHTLMDDVRGLGTDYSKYPKETLNKFIATCENAYKTLRDYEVLIKAFFVTDNIPPSLAYLPNILRRVTVLSDTDSTCATYQEWSEWYFGEVQFTQRSVGVAASVMTILTQSISHTLNLFAANMNIGPKYSHLLAMKNEFYWDVMTPCNVAKHYYAGIRIQEGNVFEERELELKGVHMIASAIPKHLQAASKAMIMEIMDKVTKKEKLDLRKYLIEILEIEKEIIDNIKKANIDYLKLDKIKELEGYKQKDQPGRTPYFHHILWQEVFAPKYGKADNPTYFTVKVPTKLDTKAKFNEWLETIEDEEMKNKFKEVMKKYGKDYIGTFRFPLMIVGERGLPKEIMNAIDIERIIKDLVNVFYIILETLGFYRKDEMTLTQMYEEGLLS